jgi:hypothetical protein
LQILYLSFFSISKVFGSTQPLGSILEAKPLRQGQNTRILGRQSPAPYSTSLIITLHILIHQIFILPIFTLPIPICRQRRRGRHSVRRSRIINTMSSAGTNRHVPQELLSLITPSGQWSTGMQSVLSGVRRGRARGFTKSFYNATVPDSIWIRVHILLITPTSDHIRQYLQTLVTSRYPHQEPLKP